MNIPPHPSIKASNYYDQSGQPLIPYKSTKNDTPTPNIVCDGVESIPEPGCTIGFSEVLHEKVQDLKTSLFDFLGWTNSIEDGAASKCEQLTCEIRIVKEKIKKFDSFILEKEDLLTICKEYINKYPYYVAFNINEPPEDLDPNNIIDRMTKLDIELIRLQHFWQERVEFIERHQPVLESFSKHVQESFEKKDQQERTQQLFLENVK